MIFAPFAYRQARRVTANGGGATPTPTPTRTLTPTPTPSAASYKIQIIDFTITYSEFIDCGTGEFGFYVEGYNTYAIRSVCDGSNIASPQLVSFDLRRYCNSFDFGVWETIIITPGISTANSTTYMESDGCGTTCVLTVENITNSSFTACEGT